MSVEDLEIKSKVDVYTPPRKLRDGGKSHYRVKIRLAGDAADLAMVKEVRYKLHDSFKKPTHVSDNSANDFRITIWTWGYFDIEAVIVDVNGDKHAIEGRVKFDPSRVVAKVDDPFESLRDARLQINKMRF